MTKMWFLGLFLLVSGCAVEVAESDSMGAQQQELGYVKSSAAGGICTYTRCKTFNGTRCTEYETVSVSCNVW